MIAEEIIERMKGLRDEKEARHLARFFKTGKGEYGEGDIFLGIRVPVTRALVKEYRKSGEIEDVRVLVDNPFHEIRLAGFLLLIEIYKKAKNKREIIDLYLGMIPRSNNWDLVDVIAPKILGDYLVDTPEDRSILYWLAEPDKTLWHQRVAMISCWRLIQKGLYSDTLQLAEHFLTHHHDLMHKASGWMLREVGKRGGLPQLLAFLDLHARSMPRTMLRYAIERLPEPQRLHYLHLQ